MFLKLFSFFTRTFARISGSERILRFFCPPKSFHVGEYVGTTHYHRNLLINVDLFSYIEWAIFFKGYYEKAVTMVMENLLKPGNIAIDVGANVGTHTLVMSKLVGKNGQVVAIEPNPSVLARLKDNAKINSLENIRFVSDAISDKVEVTDFYVSAGENVGTSSIYQKAAGRDYLEHIEVKANTIDHLVESLKLKNIKLIKIDTEGNDFKVIRGSEKSIDKFSPFVIWEFDKSSWKEAGFGLSNAVDFFNKRNYTLYLILGKKGKKRFRRLGESATQLDCVNILGTPPGIPPIKLPTFVGATNFHVRIKALKSNGAMKKR